MSAKRAVVLQHTATEGPERVGVMLAERGVSCTIRALYQGEPVPDDLGSDEILVVMGGPMGVGDVGDPRWPFLEREIALLRGLVGRDAPVLGICLGSQLLAAGAGARVYPNTRPGPSGPERVREVGWGEVDLVGADREPVLAGLGARLTVLHWHGDTYDLPPGAAHLASTPACRHQAFRLGRRQFGFQFHCELEASSIPTWVREDAEFVRAANGPGGGAQILADTDRLYVEARPAWDRLLGNAIDLLLGA
ncbi:MAG TPA: gamma-glutamyl-gamma-aminobutyrate hydrolase family protein [Polyangia bacterium]|nr:gamma-glutamyl-gamma-aminobutyrate hydrolase family protein [Polyangia bacterium]